MAIITLFYIYTKFFTCSDLRTKNEFNLIKFKPPKSTSDYRELEKLSPDIFLVDFDLSIPDEDNKVIGISGLSLATELKQKFPEIPIILFTRRSVFTKNEYLKQTLTNITEIIYKNDLFRQNSSLIGVLYNIGIGFRTLRLSKSKKWNYILKIIKSPERDINDLSLTNLPIIHKTWIVNDVAEWIINTLLKYPGILYSPLYAAVYLGISVNSFLSDPVQNFFYKAKYNGIFDPPDGRWWKSKLSEITISKMNKEERELPLLNGFPLFWNRKMKTKLIRSKCIFSGESPAEWICYILNKPVMIKYSLKYNVDPRPKVFDESRVSFEAIRISNEVNDELFDPMGKELLASIRKMNKP